MEELKNKIEEIMERYRQEVGEQPDMYTAMIASGKIVSEIFEYGRDNGYSIHDVLSIVSEMGDTMGMFSKEALESAKNLTYFMERIEDLNRKMDKVQERIDLLISNNIDTNDVRAIESILSSVGQKMRQSDRYFKDLPIAHKNVLNMAGKIIGELYSLLIAYRYVSYDRQVSIANRINQMLDCITNSKAGGDNP